MHRDLFGESYSMYISDFCIALEDLWSYICLEIEWCQTLSSYIVLVGNGWFSKI